ncbi:MAG TPA: translocation/assembly module TamB domain-containing protein, partial [Spirochaetales bacterium]|nr:translocation/assembly module TamB domain-containing protein [Spirochaetales bacterium]
AGTPSEWSVNGNLQFQGPLSLSELSRGYIPFVQGSCSVSIHDNWVPAEFKKWNIEAIKSGTLFLISGGPENAIQGAIDSKGTFSLQVGSPIPMTFDASGSFTGESIFKLSIQNIRFSLSLVRKYLDFGVFRMTEGWVSGFLRIEGPIQDPDFFGELSVVEGKAHLDLVPEELGPFSGVLAFQEKECSFQPTTLQTQGGTVQVSGLLEIEQWIPSRGKIWIDTGPKGGVRIDSNFGGVLIQGIGRGKVEITILDQEVQVTGKILATNTGITLGEIPSEDEPSSDQDERLVVDLEVESDKSVEFLWPSESFPIIRTYAALGQTLHIQLDTLQGSSLIQGDIAIRGGQIYYFDRVFYLREGRIVFNERGDAFDPIISARAEIRENTEIGLVRIYLIADNTRLSQFSPRFESDPTLSQLELFSILGANTLSLGTQEAVNLSSALLFSNDLFLQTEIIQTFEKNMRNRFNLDMFSVRTHIFQNVLSGLLTPPENLSQNQAVPSLGRYLDKTSVFLGKYIGSDLFLEYLIQLRAQDPFTSDVRKFGGIGIESEIIFEWKTPFFILEWSLRPKDPEELFILDNIIAFRWRYTY